MLPLCRRFLIVKLKHRKLQLAELDWTTNDVLVGGRFSVFEQVVALIRCLKFVYPCLKIELLVFSIDLKLVLSFKAK